MAPYRWEKDGKSHGMGDLQERAAMTEPIPNKCYEVTFKRQTRRVDANTAYYAARKAFPQAHFTEVHVTCVGKAIDAAIEAQDAQTVRPPPFDGRVDAVRVYARELADKVRTSSMYGKADLPSLVERNRNLQDFAFKLQTERRTLRAQALAGRVAARLIDECYLDSLTPQWEIPAKAFTELLLCARVLYGRGL